MRFSPIHLTLLVSLTQASPAPVAVPIAAPVPAPMCARNVADTDLIAETIVFSVESAKCKILKCASVIATGACILGALPDIDSTLACVSGKASKVWNPVIITLQNRDQIAVYSEDMAEADIRAVVFLRWAPPYPLGVILGLAALVNTAAINSTGAAKDVIFVSNNVTDLSISNASGHDPSSANTLGEGDDDPSLVWHDHCTTQVWIDKDPIQVGQKVGFDLYTTMILLLNKACPPGPTNGARDCQHAHGTGDWLGFKATCLYSWPDTLFPCSVTIFVARRYHNDKIRNNLIVAAAGALQAFNNVKSSTDAPSGGSSNWYDPPSDVGKLCIVGERVRIHFPPQLGVRRGENYMHVQLKNFGAGAAWNYTCCRSGGLDNVDRLMSNIQSEVESMFPWMRAQKWFNDSRCMINGWEACPK